ncbi:MAG TPA: DEAD/DEAH box helicase [Thermoanaerobaculia bacterium]|nr:DEAD/DEAH box helicase [Thermoanaerobaculia bacterium]
MTSTTGAFDGLGLRSELVETLGKLGYEVPTPIQARTIPLLLAGRDVIGQAQTGTGKTAAFALPILQAIDPKSKSTQAIVLTPTRELAMQVAEAIHSYGGGMGHVSVQPIYGGAPIGLQLRHLQRGVQIVVGTPGRVIDHLERRSLDLGAIRMVVLDEADEMLRMGFLEDVERILASAPERRQIALFSATMPPEVMRIAKTHLHDPERVKIEHRSVAAPAIEQRFLNVSEHQKLSVLTQILELEPNEAVLIFRRTKLGAADLAEKLEARGFAAVAMHGDMTQVMREAVIRRLRKGQVEIVVATDVAARGLDVEQISHVINYDIPNDVEAYVHRIGRTGRAGRRGVATLLVTPREGRMMRDIERFTGTSMAPMKMPTQADLAARRVAVLKENIRSAIREGNLDLHLQLVEELVDEGEHDLAEIAAAAVRLAGIQAPSREEPDRRDKVAREPAGEHEPAARVIGEERKKRPVVERKRPAEPKAQLMIAIGREGGIRPADVVGSIANEADIPGSDIGPIDIRETITLVTIPERYREKVVTALRSARFRGRSFDVRSASASEMAEPRRTAARGASVTRGKGDRTLRRETIERREEGSRTHTPFYARVSRKGATGRKGPAGKKGGAGGGAGRR